MDCSKNPLILISLWEITWSLFSWWTLEAKFKIYGSYASTTILIKQWTSLICENYCAKCYIPTHENTNACLYLHSDASHCYVRTHYKASWDFLPPNFASLTSWCSSDHLHSKLYNNGMHVIAELQKKLVSCQPRWHTLWYCRKQNQYYQIRGDQMGRQYSMTRYCLLTLPPL